MAFERHLESGLWPAQTPSSGCSTRDRTAVRSARLERLVEGKTERLFDEASLERSLESAPLPAGSRAGRAAELARRVIERLLVRLARTVRHARTLLRPNPARDLAEAAAGAMAKIVFDPPRLPGPPYEHRHALPATEDELRAEPGPSFTTRQQ